MADPKVKLNQKGVRAILKGPGQKEVARVAHAAAAEAGEGFESVVKPHKYTGRAFVQTKHGTDGAARQAREKVLQRVVGKRR